MSARWRVAARIARRELRRRPGRTALVVLLVALPVAAITGAAIWFRTDVVTNDEERRQELGQADDIVSLYPEAGIPNVVEDDDPTLDTVRAAYGLGTRVVGVVSSPDGVEGDDGVLRYVDVTDHPLDDALLDGLLRVTDGRAPRDAGEVAVSRAVLDATGAEIGETVDLLLGGEATVTGTVQDPSDYDRMLIVGPDAPTPHRDSSWQAYVDAPPASTGPDQTMLDRIFGTSQGWWDGTLYLGDDSPENRVVGTQVAGGLVLVMGALVASAAFAVGARRQLRTLGVLGASGAAPDDLRRAVLCQGLTAGVVGSLIGVGLSVGAWLALFPFFDDLVNRDVGSLEIHPLDVGVATMLGVVAATAAAWMPARTAARVPILTALAGRRPNGRVPAGMPLAGVAAVVTGFVVMANYAEDTDRRWWVGLAGLLAVLFGTIAVLPWVVSAAEAFGRRLSGSGRVAVRDLGRQRLRTVAVVAALLGPAGIATYNASNAAISDADARDAAETIPSSRFDPAANQVLFTQHDDEQLAAVRDILPDATETPVELVVADPTSVLSAVAVEVTDPEAAEGTGYPSRYLIAVPPEWARAEGFPDAVVDALAGDRIVMFEALPARATLALTNTTVPIDRDDIVVDLESRVINGFQVALVGPDTVRRWGLPTVRYGTVLTTPDPITASQESRVYAVYEASTSAQCRREYFANFGCDEDDLRAYLRQPAPNGAPSPSATFAPRDPEMPNDQRTVAAIGFGASLVVTLMVVALALALTGAESRDERALLEAIGAPPALRRSLATWQALLLPALATALAVPVALGLSYVLLQEEANAGFQIPWIAVGLLVVAVPLASAGVTWLGATMIGRGRRDLSTLAFTAD